MPRQSSSSRRRAAVATTSSGAVGGDVPPPGGNNNHNHHLMSSRTAAIQAAERRRREEEQQQQQCQQQQQQEQQPRLQPPAGHDDDDGGAADIRTAEAALAGILSEAATAGAPSTGITSNPTGNPTGNLTGNTNINTKPTAKRFIKKYLPPFSSFLSSSASAGAGPSAAAAAAATTTSAAAATTSTTRASAAAAIAAGRCPNDNTGSGSGSPRSWRHNEPPCPPAAAAAAATWQPSAAAAAATARATTTMAVATKRAREEAYDASGVGASCYGAATVPYRQGGSIDVNEDDGGGDDDDDEGCLHCHRKVKRLPRIAALKDGDGREEEDDICDDHDGNNSNSNNNVQVRCDDCGSYVCTGCHWCHEFQANHEVRVCDRCDSFYCRACDEMDQCDDCGEVVCGGCSTLLSCKFCGGGLCEECATACGRCGIVLCSRDAKFAVDCDTCRLSYCLVCLASGSKDPCVRCGHRPSKRMEQLVHLRLKSIYKAFKSSNNSSSGGDGGGGNNSNVGSSAAAVATHSGNVNHHGQRRKKPTTLQDMVGDGGDDYGEGDDAVLVGAMDYGDEDDDDAVEDVVDDDDDEDIVYLQGAERKNSVGGSYSGSHTMPYYGNQSGGGIMGTDILYAHPILTGGTGMLSESLRNIVPDCFFQQQDLYLDQQKKADEAAQALLAELEEEEEAMAQKLSKKKKKKARKASAASTSNKQIQQQEDSGAMVGDDDAPTEDASEPRKKTLTKQESSSYSEGAADVRSSDERSRERRATEEGEEDLVYGAHDRGGADDQVKMDPIEKELVDCVERCDIDGIDDILIRIKGVPGRAALRKNAKKALKRLRLELSPLATDDPTPAEAIGMVDDQPWQPTAPNKISSTSTEVVGPKTMAATGLKTNTKSPHPRSSIKATAVSPRAESTIQISATLVGWIIGKGGQRIRDMMEESGAKIWIDQEKVKGQSIRSVYISGDRASVEHGTKLVKMVVANAPLPPGSTAPAATTSPTVSGPTSSHVGKATHPVSGPISQRQSIAAHAVSVELAMKQNEASIPETLADRLKESTNAEPAVSVQHPSAWGWSKDEEHASLAIQNASAQVHTTPLDADSPNAIATGTQTKGGEMESFAEVVDCEARFVPLLIGRRGWTIKQIQDESGARVDIDQTVTPRQVRISGNQANVEKAVIMVRDVLAYPHAQLQSSSEGAEEIIANVPLLSDTNVLTVARTQACTEGLMATSASAEEAANNVPSFLFRDSDKTGETSDRNHSPPPIVGDAKSAISASSSLSSTPEPSMASSSKGLFAASQLQNCSSMPSNPELYTSVDNSRCPAPSPFLQPEIAMVDASASRGYIESTSAGVAAAASHSIYGQVGGHIGMHSGRFGVPLGPAVHELQHSMYSQPSKSTLPMGQGMMQIPHHLQQHHQNYQPHQHASTFGPAVLMPQRIQFPNNAKSSPITGATGQFDFFGNSPQAQEFRSASANAGYNHYPNDGMSSAQAIASTPLGHLMNNSVGRGDPSASLPLRPAGYETDSGGAYWNSNASSYLASRSHAPRLPPVTPTGYSTNSLGFSSQQHRPQHNPPPPQLHQRQHHDAAVATQRFMRGSDTMQQQTYQHQQQHQDLPNTGVSELARFSSPFAASTLSIPRNNDSIMIDSLFGGTDASTAGGGSDLLTSFNGLSLAGELEPATTSGLWGPSLLSETWAPTAGDVDTKNNSAATGNSATGIAGVARASSSIDHLFSEPKHNFSEEHPDHSRFNWSSTNT